MAVHGFKGLGWFLCGVIAAPTCYMVTSHGAAERARLRALDSAILQAKADIRSLETEFDTRANIAQIERWNGDVLAMNAPAPQQYLASVEGLAALDRPASIEDESGRVETAALVIPAAAPAVQAAAPALASADRGGQGKPSTASRVAQGDDRQDGKLASLMKKVDRSGLATADRPLLSASTISDLNRLARREQLALR
ncbi:hypothetical protein ACX40Y_15670 [Sphingomonas sp. RS6]